MKKKIMKQLDVILFYLTKLHRIEELLEEINKNAKPIELAPMHIGEGINRGSVDFSSQNDISVKAKLRKRYIVKDIYHDFVVAEFYNKTDADKFVEITKHHYVKEVD